MLLIILLLNRHPLWKLFKAAMMVSVIIPTLNEEENIEGVLKRTNSILDAIDGIDYEILIVDDCSCDNTVCVAERAVGKNGRVIKRDVGKKSLSLSVVHGIKQSKGEAIIVMDGDGSHPPDILPYFIENLKSGYDLIVASRYIKGGSTENFSLSRKFISRSACFLGSVLTDIQDNTSGFFCVRKCALEGVNLTPIGFKIGLEVFVKGRFNSYKEIPYTFLHRQKGISKLKSSRITQYLNHFFKLLVYKFSRKEK